MLKLFYLVLINSDTQRYYFLMKRFIRNEVLQKRQVSPGQYLEETLLLSKEACPTRVSSIAFPPQILHKNATDHYFGQCFVRARYAGGVQDIYGCMLQFGAQSRILRRRSLP